MAQRRFSPVLAIALLLLLQNGPALVAQEIEPTVRVAPASGLRVVVLTTGLNRPFGMAWLPDGGLLITEKSGGLRLWRDGRLTDVSVDRWPTLYAEGQGGLLDIALHPRFEDTGWVYFTAGTGTAAANRTEVLRGVWRDGRIEAVESLYRIHPDKPGTQHFGSRLLWLPDGTMLVSIGDGGNAPLALDGVLFRDLAQRLDIPLGKVLRLQEDGKPAPDNPWAAGGALAEIWTYGHRNIQGLAYDPVHQRVLASEHGSRGGDELNVLKAGGNYGWPAVTYSREYWGPAISERRTTLGMEDPVVVWTPATAPSGLAVYTGDRPMKWRGSVFSGGLLSRDVRRIQLDNRGHVLEQESIPIGGRVRDVRQGPDGFLYVLTDERRGRLLRIELELP